MKTMVLFILASNFIVFMNSCNILFPDDNLTLKRMDYTGNELKTDGYYYCFTENSNTIVYFLYKNGIILCAHSYASQNLNIVEAEMVKIYPEIRKQKDSWGVFSVNRNKIEYEIWNTSTGFSLPIIRRKGYIKNDTAFCITESYFSDINKTYYDEKIYYFKQFTNKPDSTNSYIK